RATWLPAALLAASLLAVLHCQRGARHHVDTAGWTVDDMARHLGHRGLPLRGGPQTSGNAYLTRSPPAGAELLFPWQGPGPGGHLRPEWAGTVHCRQFQVWDDMGGQLADWPPGEWCAAGRFLFHGDPALIAEIRDALAQ